MERICHGNQVICYGAGAAGDLARMLSESGGRRAFIVCTPSFAGRFRSGAWQPGIPFVLFSEFQPNPLYESVVKGVRLFQEEGCDCIVSIGGGSAIDVAKCINLFAALPQGTEDFLAQPLERVAVPHLCIPTTAGTGSESTRFAVIYAQGKKQSVTSAACIPDRVLLDPELLLTLPADQKKASSLDALCQAIESYWSVHSSPESQHFARQAIRLILGNLLEYLNGAPQSAAAMLLGANLAGRAIDLTQTTAAHAMSYQITSKLGLPHGRAAAICLPAVWEYLLAHPERCVDERGGGYLNRVTVELAGILGLAQPEEGPARMREILYALEMQPDISLSEQELSRLAGSVNPVRLRNFPVSLREADLYDLYSRVFAGTGQEEAGLLARRGQGYLKRCAGMTAG